NIAEMFQQQAQTYYVSGTGDPCGLNTNTNYGANPARNPNAAQARAICEQLMDVGAPIFYDPANTQPNGTSGAYWLNTVGNPAVNPEEPTTITAGFVFQPNTGRPLRDGFSGTLDWYQIEIDDMIASETLESVYEACLSVSSNPTGNVLHPACQRIQRNPA